MDLKQMVNNIEILTVLFQKCSKLPGLQLGPKNFEDALIFDSNGDKSSSHSRATIVDSKYWKQIE